MNTLTKVFVVLLVIFSIAFTMMTVQFSAMTPDWRDQAITWKTQAQVIDTHNRNLIAAKVAEAARAEADRREWDEQRGELTLQLQKLQTEVDDFRAKLAKAEADSSTQDATLKKLAAELSIAQTIAAKAREHRSTLEARNIELEKRNLDISESLNERITTVVVLEQQVRQQEQAINLLKRERDKLLKKLRLSTAGLEETMVTVPTDKVRAAKVARVAPIRGKISQVAGEYASVSVGANDGVEAGMIFIIYNERGYLGDLIVSDVKPNTAAGRLKNVSGQIGVGSMVVDEQGYLAMN